MAADDHTPTNPQSIDVLAAQIDGLRRDPSDRELFEELYAALREAGNPAPLADVCELHAPTERDPQRAATHWADAGEARFHLSDDERGERDLRQALALDPANERAVSRLTEHYMVAERWAEAAEVMEQELATLTARLGGDGGRAFATRRAQRHRMLGQLWDKHLGRVDQALMHWQKAWQLEPEVTDALEAARAIYASLGDERMVARLYELELESLGPSRPDESAPRGAPGGAGAVKRARRAWLERQLGELASRRGDPAASIAHLERALRLAPGDQGIEEMLAERYAGQAAPENDAFKRATELYLDLGRAHTAGGDLEGAIKFQRRALGVNPRSEHAASALAQSLTAAEKWAELERYYQQRIDSSSGEDDEEIALLLGRRAELLEHRLGKPDLAKQALAQLASRQPPGGAAARKLRDLYAKAGDWHEWAALVERELEGAQLTPEQRIADLLALAQNARDHLSDRDKAAACLHQVLTISPNQPEALARYADHFREKRDWRGLADLAEFAVEAAREAGLPDEEIGKRLEELAQVSELRLGDVERALSAWKRLEEQDPANSKAKEAIRRLLSRAKMWESLVAVLEKEAAAAGGPKERAEALKRIAQVFRERQVDPRRAIALYEDALELAPADAPTLKALADLYEREGDDAGVCRTLRRQLDADYEKVVGEAKREGKRPPATKEWPVALRVERLTTLRRLAAMYENRLADVEGVVWACTAILELMPGDRDALERLERTLERAGEAERYEQTLEYHAEAATGPAERAKVLRKLARLAVEREDEVLAVERWEKLLRAAPNDGETLRALAELYERIGRYPEMAAMLDRALSLEKPPEPGTPAAAARAFELQRLARTVDAKLGDSARAVKAWRQVIEIFPYDREALKALTRLYEAAGLWRDLCDVLARQVPLYSIGGSASGEDRAAAAQIAFERARILEEKLASPKDAAIALEALIKEIDPRHADAHTSLRRIYEARGDFNNAVRIAERELYLAEHPLVKVARGLEIGLLCRDRLHDPRRALQAFERVLTLEPGHPEALQAASELYARVGDWQRHVRALERLAEHAPEGKERRVLYTRIAHAVDDKLADPAAAFVWFRKAHEHAPDDATLAELRRAAEAHGLWRELAEVWEAERERATTPMAKVAAGRELAAIVERRLGDRTRALGVLATAVEAMPEDDSLVAEAERIAAEAGSGATPWQALLGIYAVALGRRGSIDVRVSLHEKRSRVREERLDDARGALDELLAAFALAPEREATREGILRLAEKSRRWDDALAVEAALLGRATDLPARLTVARRTAVFLEEKVGDRTRAFRSWLRTMTLAPDDADTSANLWRLAKVIGKYREHEKQAKPEPAPAQVSAPQPSVRGRTTLPPPMPDALPEVAAHIESSKPRRESTQEISVSEFIIESSRSKVNRSDSTIPLELGDLADLITGPAVPPSSTPASGVPAARGPLGMPRPANQFAGPDPTIEIKTEDLIQALSGGARVPPPPPELSAQEPRRPGAPPAPGRRTSAPPLPAAAARLPGVHAKPATPRSPPRTPAKATGPRQAAAGSSRGAIDAAMATLAALPRSLAPDRRYETPWEELAAAVEAIPSADTQSRLAHLFRAAEVWERGAVDLDRAFDTLARALKLAPEDTETRERLARMADEQKAWARLVDLYEDAADHASEAPAAASLLFEVATIHARRNDGAAAESILRRILGMRPDDARARTELESLLERQGRWVDLSAILEERTDPRLGSAAPEAERAPFLRQLAAIYDEKLGKPYEAITALERLRELLHDAPDTLDGLATLYAKVGRWAKVVEALTRLADLVDTTERSREARRRVAQIYQRELELPERAIEAYEGLLAGWPDDADALEAQGELLESVARWADLAEVLRRRAALAPEPITRAQLLRRRAAILLEWLDQPDEAVASLRHARTITPEDPTLAEDMVTALSRSGRAREAAAVLEGRVATLEQAGSAPGDVAALLLRLAELRAEQLDDRDGARRVLERVLTQVPDHPSALAALARLERGGADPRAYAQARLREAGVTADLGARVDALLDAGRTLRDKLGDTDGARAAFAQVIDLEPANAEAIWALAELAAGGGELDVAVQLLEGRLADGNLPADEIARVRTELAALSLRAGVAAGAARHLDEALRAKPDHVPAVIALADLYLSGGNIEELEAFLREALPQLAEASSTVRAELDRRLAEACEKLGRDDEGYQLLLEADKLHRNDLLIKLALGENRYRARRWREAALHLGTLADHPEAKTRAKEVAEGVYHAALAEIRSLRPERAQGLYEKAIALDPEHAQSLHALAEIFIEKGDIEHAADLLERQAAATPEHSERLRLFEALGDLALRALDDKVRAKVCFEAAVAAAKPLEARHLPLLEKLRDCQKAIGEWARAGMTCELMASFGADGATRAARWRDAAECYLVAHDAVRARTAAERAFDADPTDEHAIWTASELALEASDSEAAASLLGRALRTLAPPGPGQEPRRAELWRRLGDARRGRGDSRGATEAYERAVQMGASAEVEPDATLAARRALVALAGADHDKAEMVCAHLRALVRAEQRPDEVLALGRALSIETQAGAIDEDGARAVLELAAALGQRLEDSDTGWLERHPARQMAVDEAYHGSVDESERAALISDPDDEPLYEALAALWEAAPVLWPDPARALEAAAAERVPPAAQGDAAAIYPQVSRALAAPATVLWVTAAAAAPDVSLACAAPPLVLLGPRVLLLRGERAPTANEPLSASELRFVLGRAVELARPERVPAVGLPRAAFARLVAGLVRAYGNRPDFLTDGVTAEEADQEAERLRKALTLKARLRIEPALQRASLARLDPAAYRAACERAADRAGLVASGDVRGAVRLVGGAGRAQHLVRLAVEERFLAVRAKLVG